MRLVKDARLSLPLTDVMKIVRLTSPLLDAPRQSSPRPRLRHGRRLTLLFHLNLTLNLCTLFFAISLAHLPRLLPLLTSPTVLLPGNRLRSMPLTCDPTFPFLSQRPCVAKPEAISLSSAEPRALWSLTRPSALLPPPRWILCGCLQPFLVHCHWPRQSCLSHSKASSALAWIFFFISSISLGICISFPFIWKTSFIIPIHKMEKPLDSPASFRPISLTSCVSKLFERIILSRLLFFLESNSILSPRQAGFRPGQSTLVLYLSQSISDGFNKSRPGFQTVLAAINFSKAFDSVWHPALFHKLISAGLPPCFARWTQSFLSDRRACMVFQNHKSCFFRVGRGVPQGSGSVFGPVLFSLFINDLRASLPSSVSCSLYADDLAIWSSSPSVPSAMKA